MAKSLYTHKESNIIKTWLLMTGFFLFIIAVGWGASWYTGSSVILYIAVALSVMMSFFSYWYSDKLVLKMTNAQPATMDNFPELYRITENLAITAGLPMPKLYYVEDSQPNAFATGRDPDHAVVAVTSGLMQVLDRSELEGVIAHELSHIGNRDMLISTVAVVLGGVIAIMSDIFLRSLIWGGGRRSNNRAGGLVLVFAIVGAILAPLAAAVIRLAISRKREFLADASGALLTRHPEALASALDKIARSPKQMRSGANNATAHLWISDPFRGKARQSFFHTMFMTHPPVERRIAALRGMDEGNN